MDEEARRYRHEANNAQQQVVALTNLIERAANNLDDLAEANCSREAVEEAHLQAGRLRQAADATKAQINGDAASPAP